MNTDQLEQGLDLFDQNRYREALEILNDMDHPIALAALLYYNRKVSKYVVFETKKYIHDIEKELWEIIDDDISSIDELCFTARDYRWMAYLAKEGFDRECREDPELWESYAIDAWDMGDVWVSRLIVQAYSNFNQTPLHFFMRRLYTEWLEKGCNAGDDECLCIRGLDRTNRNLFENKDVQQSAAKGNIRSMHYLAMIECGRNGGNHAALKEVANRGGRHAMQTLARHFVLQSNFTNEIMKINYVDPGQGEKIKQKNHNQNVAYACWTIRSGLARVHAAPDVWNEAEKRLKNVVVDVEGVYGELLKVPHLKALEMIKASSIIYDAFDWYALRHEIDQGVHNARIKEGMKV